MLGITTPSNEFMGGICSFAVYFASFFVLGCTCLGVPIMNIVQMFEWCGRALRVTNDSNVALN